MANLKSQGKNVAAKEVYADLDMNFTPHPITGDLTIKKDTDAIKQSIKNIMLTNYYERKKKEEEEEEADNNNEDLVDT